MINAYWGWTAACLIDIYYVLEFCIVKSSVSYLITVIGLLSSVEFALWWTGEYTGEIIMLEILVSQMPIVQR